jgi:molybdopterin-binding protein
VTHYRISEVAGLLQVSDDTVRRHVESGRLPAATDGAGRRVVSGVDLARFVRREREQAAAARSSARNRLPGIVTAVERDGLVAVVEVQAGPFRLVSMMTREAADDLGLEIGERATAVVKSTTVVVERGPQA